MGHFFYLLDKYKVGIFSAAGVYLVIFLYLHLHSFQKMEIYEPFEDGPRIEIPKDEVQLKAENMLVPENFEGQELLNMSRDRSDKRQQSDEDYGENIPEESVDVSELERQMYEESGGAKERAEIQQKIEERRNREEKEREKQRKEREKRAKSEATNAGKNAPKGMTMVEFEVSGHTAYKKNNWYVRNPGYTCDGGSGTVYISIKVDNGGNVVNATYEPTHSAGASPCMIEKALKYARMSRFNYSSSVKKVEQGWILYRFVAG